VSSGSEGTTYYDDYHDYGPNWAHPGIAAAVVAAVEPFGITVLRNEISEVEGLQFAGVDDLWAKQFDLQRVLPRLDARRASIGNHNFRDAPGVSAGRTFAPPRSNRRSGEREPIYVSF